MSIEAPPAASPFKGKMRWPSLVAASLPFALACATICAFALPMVLREPWPGTLKVLQLVGVVFAGLLLPFVSHVRDGWWVAIVGWALVVAWISAVRWTRVGDWAWGVHSGIAMAWLASGAFCLGYAALGV